MRESSGLLASTVAGTGGFKDHASFADFHSSGNVTVNTCREPRPLVQELSKRVGAGISSQNDVALVTASGTGERNLRAIFEILSLQDISRVAFWTQNARHFLSMFQLYHLVQV
jgi:hypothetical protein